MCILCVIQKWSRRVATMLPWLVIPLIGLWALSQLLPPAFRFEITSPRLACVFVLLVTLFWYEILMPRLSAWRARRNARLRERKRFEAIEMQKLRKTATRRCRNCLTPYRDQNPGGGKFMCSYCGHISKRPVLDLPVPPGLGVSNPEILKDLVGKSGRILNGKVWSDNGWMCGQDWLDNGNWVGGSFAGILSYWKKNGGGFFGGDDHCLTEKSYSGVITFACKALTTFFCSIMWLWKKIFSISSSRGDASADMEHRAMLVKRGENGSNFQESRGEKARRKAEEKRLARLEKEQLEEEERKQREEVARLVEERRKQRDEKMETEKQHGKRSPTAREWDRRNRAEKKRQERKKEKDRGSSKSNSDAEELERKVGREIERNKKSETGRQENQRNGPEGFKTHGMDTGHGSKSATTNSHNRGNVGTGYLDRMRGTFLSSSRAFTGGGFFGRGASTSASASASRDHKSNGSLDHVPAHANRRELAQHENIPVKSFINGEDKNISRPVLIEPQPSTVPKKSWQQLFTHSSAAVPSPNSNVIGRPNGKSQAEHRSPSFPTHQQSVKLYDNPINFGLPSPFTLSTFSDGSANSITGPPSVSETLFPKIGEAPCEFLPEESDIFEDPCYVPDPVSLLGPVSESLDYFQDLGFVTETGLDKSHVLSSRPASPEVNRQSPIESPISQLLFPEDRQATSFLFPCTSKAQDVHNLHVNDSNNSNENGTWQMWNSNPLGQDGLGLVSGSATWLLPPELNRSNKEDIVHPAPQKTMASLFKKDDQVLSGTHSPQKVFLGNCQNDGTFNSSVPGDDSWLPRTLFGPMSGSENQYFLKPHEEITTQKEMVYGSPRRSAASSPFELPPLTCWAKNDWTVQSSGVAIGNSSIARPHIGGLYPTPDVQSLWSYD